MASGSFRFNDEPTYLKGQIVWSSSGSEVTASLQVAADNGHTGTTGTWSWSLTIGSSSKSGAWYGFIGEDWVTVASRTVTVSGSTAYLYGKCSAPSGTSQAGKYVSGSKTVTLEETPEYGASSISLSANEVQMGKHLLISISKNNQNAEHYLEYWFSEYDYGGIADYVDTSHTWTVPDFAARCNNATSIVCWIVCYTYLNGSYIGYTEEPVTLTVPDPTTPSISGGAAAMGTSATISCARNSSNFTLQLSCTFQGVTVSIQEGKIDSCNWTPGYDLAKQIPALTYATGILTCVTKNGTAVVGTRTSTIRITVPENSTTKPSFSLSGLTLTPISDLGSDFDGLYLLGKTGLQAEFSASSEYSTISSYSITAGSASADGNPAIIDLLINEGEVKITAKVTDARGFSATVNTTIQVLSYQKPKVTPYTGYNNVICERAKNTGELDPSGTYLAIRAGKSFSSVILNGVEKNDCSLKYRWKSSGAGSYGGWITLLAEGSGDSQISVLVGNIVTSLDVSYDVQIQAEDTLGGVHTLTFAIMTEAVSFVLYDGVDGAGFGKYPEAPHVVDIASHMTLRVRGKLVVDGDAWVNLDLAEGIHESVYAYGRKEDTGCHYMVTNGNHVIAAFNCMFSFAGTSLVINSAVIPTEHRPPRPVFSLCPVNDRSIALVSVNPDGYIRVEWVQLLTDTVLTGAAEVLWIDGYLDYWI